MENINVGITNLIISENLRKSYFNDSLNSDSRKMTNNFLEILKNSPILQLEFKVFNNIENKYIENDVSATRYIDNNIKLFEIFTISEINKEHEKFHYLINETSDIDFDDLEVNYKEKLKLYNAISSLIKESITYYNNIDINEMHDSFSYILNHIKTPKKRTNEENPENNLINENIIEIAVDKFNEKYKPLNEDDRNLIHKLISSNNDEKIELFEIYKKDTLDLLENAKNTETNPNIVAAINKIEKMVYVTYKSEIEDDIINLHELKKGML